MLISKILRGLSIGKLRILFAVSGYLSLLSIACYRATATVPDGNLNNQMVQVTPSAWDNELKQAKELRNSGKLKEAIAIYQQILTQDPQQKAAKAGLALTLAWDDRLDESIKLYRELIQAEPNDLELLQAIGTAYTWKGDWAEAIATYRQILKLEPTNRPAKLGIAQVYSWDNKFDEAISAYQELLAAEPDNIDIKLKLAQTLSWADRLDAALEMYEKVIDRHPPSSQALAGRAQITFWMGKPIKAIALYKQALKTFPNDAPLTVGLARVYHAQQASGKALKLIEPFAKSGDRDANKLLADIRKSGKPKLQFGFNSLTDSDNLNVQTYSGKISTAIAPQSQIELAVERNDIAQPQLDEITTNLYQLNWHQIVDSQWQISARVGIADYSDNVLWHLKTRWQPTDEISLSAEIDSRPLGATIQTIENNVSLTSYNLGGDFTLDEKTRFGLGIGRLVFNPYNRRDGVLLYANRVVVEEPFRLELGYLFRNFGYDDSPGLGYFSPSRFVQHGALVSLNVPVNKNFSLFSRNLIGVQQIDEGERELSLDLTAGLNWQLSDQANFKLQYHHFNISTSQGGGGYNANEFSTQLSWIF